MAYSFYALYASGTEAVFGGMLVTAVGYLLFGYIAERFLGSTRRPDAGVEVRP
jgi:putrescine:ornithine antiporter